MVPLPCLLSTQNSSLSISRAVGFYNHHACHLSTPFSLSLSLSLELCITCSGVRQPSHPSPLHSKFFASYITCSVVPHPCLLSTQHSSLRISRAVGFLNHHTRLLSTQNSSLRISRALWLHTLVFSPLKILLSVYHVLCGSITTTLPSLHSKSSCRFSMSRAL